MIFKKLFSKNDDLPITESDLKELFKGCCDVQIQVYYFGKKKVKTVFVSCEGLIDTKQVNDTIIPSLEEYFMTHSTVSKDYFLKNWHISSLAETIKKENVIEKVFNGDLLLLFENEKELFSLNTSNHPQRQPNEAVTESSIRGSRDGFIEEIATNVALIRKRLKTPSLQYEKFTIGKRTHTKVALLYIDDIIDQRTIDDVRKKLQSLNVDALTTSTQLEELLSERRFPVFPYFDYTQRPDYTTELLLRGRFVLIVDGSPSVLSGPANILLLAKSPEDASTFYLYSTLQRVIRFLSFFMAVILPGFWVALLTYHQNQIPYLLLSTIVTSRRGLPFNTPTEVMLVLFVFELLREAGVRLPAPASQTLSVVGGIVIGDAAIRAGFVSPATLVVSATSAIATFTLVNQALTGIVSLLRFFILIISSIFGLYGLLVSLFFIIIYLANMKVYNTPYLSPVTPINGKELLKSLFRIPYNDLQSRPATLNTQDKTKKGN